MQDCSKRAVFACAAGAAEPPGWARHARVLQAFLSGQYKRELNRDNPLGNHGELAEAFGNLMQMLWKVGLLYLAPSRKTASA